MCPDEKQFGRFRTPKPQHGRHIGYYESEILTVSVTNTVGNLGRPWGRLKFGKSFYPGRKASSVRKELQGTPNVREISLAFIACIFSHANHNTARILVDYRPDHRTPKLTVRVTHASL